MKSVGIIGNGVVGGAIAKGFSSYAQVRIYDKNPKRSTNPLNKVCDSDFVFICVPTPMTNASGGECNLDILYDICSEVQKFKKPIYIVKSTVPIGTTKDLKSKFQIKIIHNPEFLTAKKADSDFLTPSRTILGGVTEWVYPVKSLYEERFPGVPVLTMTSDESEAVKYMCNCFLACKVMLFNEMYFGLKEYGIDWKRVMEGVMTDGRISHSHNQVPGPDGDYGFGGVCFSKDICSLIAQMEKMGFDPLMLKAAWEQNKKIRKNWDWEYNPSAVREKKCD